MNPVAPVTSAVPAHQADPGEHALEPLRQRPARPCATPAPRRTSRGQLRAGAARSTPGAAPGAACRPRRPSARSPGSRWRVVSVTARRARNGTPAARAARARAALSRSTASPAQAGPRLRACGRCARALTSTPRRPGAAASRPGSAAKASPVASSTHPLGGDQVAHPQAPGRGRRRSPTDRSARGRARRRPPAPARAAAAAPMPPRWTRDRRAAPAAAGPGARPGRRTRGR